MDLSCPNCGAETEVPGVLIPGARITTTCLKCGAKFGGVVPARAETRGRREDSGPSGRGRREAMQKERQRGRGGHRSQAPDAPSRPPSGRKGEESTGGPREGRTPLRAVAKGLDPERLAKLVASDMFLYNREKIERAVGQGCLLSDMAAEIVEAWEFYKGRVGEETAKGTSYFRDAVNSVFGEGEPIL